MLRSSKQRSWCRFGEWNLKEVDFLNTVQLITAKPVVYLVNLTEKAYIKKKSKWLPKVCHAPLWLAMSIQQGT